MIPGYGNKTAFGDDGIRSSAPNNRYHFLRGKKQICFLFLILGTCFLVLPGCDFLYRLLHKEGAEEKQLLGGVFALEKNPKVEEIQKLLKLFGYAPGKIDGLLGGKTRQAIAGFQEDNGLPVTRFVDLATWERLTVFEEYGLLNQGELNWESIQFALKEAGFDPGPVDGNMGKRTAHAVIQFQKANGLKADGKIGYKTLSKLVDNPLKIP